MGSGSLHAMDYAVLTVYMLLMMGIGLRFRAKDASTDDYLLGGRSISAFVAGISYLMTLLSTISMVAVPGLAYTRGVTLSLQSFIAPIFGLAAFHLFIRFYFLTRTFTPFDYLEQRFDNRIRTLAAAFYWFTRVILLGLVLYATSLVFAGACGWPKATTILLAGGVGMTYTFLGGLSAVAWTDLIQFVVLVGGMGVLLIKIILAMPDGATGILTYAFANGRGMPELMDPAFYSLSPFLEKPEVSMTLLGMVLFILNDHLFYNSADQMSIQRLLSTSGYRQARRSLIWCFVLQVPALMAIWYVGLAIFAFYGLLPESQRPVQGDLALYQFIGTQLPAPLPGLIIAAMLAAVMSTISGGFNSLATVATVDFYQRLFRPEATQAQQVRFSRVVTLVLGVASILMGLVLTRLAVGTMVETSFTWLSLVAGLPPVFLLGVLSRRATAAHAWIALVIACAVTGAMIAYYLNMQDSQRPLNYMFVCVPGPALRMMITFTLTRFALGLLRSGSSI